jgi:two-component system cell cycle response regulator
MNISEIAVTDARQRQGAVDLIQGDLTAPRLLPPEAGFPLDQLPRPVQAIGVTVGVETIAVTCQAGLLSARLVLGRQTIELILSELFENAKKFHPQHAPAAEVLLVEGHAETVCIQVRDDGVRLTPEQLAQAWSPYYQGEKYFTGEEAGMGLGLARVATIVSAIGGTCLLTNRDDRPGVVVELSLPVTKIHQHERG